MNSIHYLPYPTRPLVQRPFAFRFAIVLCLAVAVVIAWALIYPMTTHVCTQCPLPVPAPTPPVVPVVPSDSASRTPPSLPKPEAVPTPPTRVTTPELVITPVTSSFGPLPKSEGLSGGATSGTDWLSLSLLAIMAFLITTLEAINKRNAVWFTGDDLDWPRSRTDSAALANAPSRAPRERGRGKNARLYANLFISYDSTLEALAAALDLRDRGTEGHSRRVVEYTACLARQIGLDERTIADIRRGALLHDIGKIGVPDAVLHKPGPLSPEERRIIEQHPQAGYEMLMGIPHLQEEVKIVLAHQEKWDGTGYPLGLKGDAIPLGARLFAIADTFDALTSDRPYRKSGSYAVARQIIISESGKQFDPWAVEAFCAIGPEEWDHIRARVMEQVSKRHAVQAERVRQASAWMLNPDGASL